MILDDWLDGVETTLEAALKELSAGMGSTEDMDGMNGTDMRMGGMLMGATSKLLGGDAGDVYYPSLLVNRRPPGGLGDLHRETRHSAAHPLHQRGKRHGLQGRARRSCADDHPHRWLPGPSGRGGQRADRHGRAL